MGFKVLAGMAREGWQPAVGDTLRALGSAEAVAMLSPAAGCFFTAAPPLFRMRVLKTMAILEVRRHDAKRATRGRWHRLDSAPRPKGARAWAKLAKFWAWYAGEAAEGTPPPWGFVGDKGRDHNRCRSGAHANRHAPSFVGGPGQGRKGKTNPKSRDAFGFSPANGYRCGTHDEAKLPRKADR